MLLKTFQGTDLNKITEEYNDYQIKNNHELKFTQSHVTSKQLIGGGSVIVYTIIGFKQE